jgi:hypothetical protein
VNALQQDFASHMIAWAMFLRVGGEPALSSLSLTPRKFASGLLPLPARNRETIGFLGLFGITR